MSDKYVSQEAIKNALVDKFKARIGSSHIPTWNDAFDAVTNLPAADVVERPRWIPVTERLPGKHQWCLVVGENLYDMDFINSRGVWTIHDKPYAPIDYWMPLPEPPKDAAAASYDLLREGGGQDEASTGPYDLLYEEGGANTT